MSVKELDYVVQKFGINLNAKHMPIEIPNTDRTTLSKLFHELDYKTGVEIGVEQGAYAERLCKDNPQAHIYGVDPWEHYSKYREHVSQVKLDTFYQATLTRMAPYHWTPIRKYSRDGAQDFKDGSLDFVYIDGNHTLPYIIDDLVQWTPKVRKGGIISGHDFLKRKRPHAYECHVVEAVYAFTQSYGINPWFVLGTKTPQPNEVRESVRSFFWVKL